METFLPCHRRNRRWSDRTKQVSFPLFPGYVFFRVPPGSHYGVLSTPGVVGVVRSGGRPAILKPDEIANVRRFADGLSACDVSPDVVPLPAEGSQVRIAEGPFQGVHGVVLDHRGRRRIVVGLPAIGCGIRVDVDSNKVVPLQG